MRLIGIGRSLALLLVLISASSLLILNSQPMVFAHGTVDQSWAPGGSPGGNAIQYHAPIGQSFKPTLDNLVGVDVSVLNDPNVGAAETTYAGGNAIDYHSPIGQSFTPTYAIFTGFDVYLMNSAGADLGVTMNLRSGSIGGPIIGSKTFAIPGPSGWGWVHLDMPSTISVNPGSLYVLQLVEPVGGVSWGANTPGTYAGGNAIYNGADNLAFDNMFRTFGVTDRLTLNIRSGSIGGAIVGTSTISVSVTSSFTWTHVDFTQFGITPGSTYVIEVVDPQGSASWAVSIPGGYPDGAAIISGSATTGDNWFRTYGIPPAAFDFSISVTTSSSVTVTQGSTASWGVQVNLASGSTQPVTLTATGVLPAGATPNTPITNSPSFTTTVSIGTTASTPVGTYPLTISAAGGSVTHSVPIVLIVNPVPPTPDFSISSSTMTISVTQGASGGSTISVTSLNGFSAAVALSPSWVGSAPSGVTFNLPSPITPPSGSTATSPLTVTASGAASTGSYTLRVTGTSGSLTHQVDIAVQITALATTTGGTTATVTTTASPTAPGVPTCLIATATYGSELSPEVQFLRNFRDNAILKTRAGSNFMVAFNAWYYSFSPGVAQFITQHPNARTGMKFILYPLIGILRIGASVFQAFQANAEAGAVLSGLVVSLLIGAAYAALPVTVILAFTSRGRRIARRLERPAVVVLMFGLAAVGLAEVFIGSTLMIIATSTSVLAALVLSTLLVSRTLVRIMKRY